MFKGTFTRSGFCVHWIYHAYFLLLSEMWMVSCLVLFTLCWELSFAEHLVKQDHTQLGYCDRETCQGDLRSGNLATVAMPRTVTKVVPSKDQDEGVGARVRRSIGGSQVFLICCVHCIFFFFFFFYVCSSYFRVTAKQSSTIMECYQPST